MNQKRLLFVQIQNTTNLQTCTTSGKKILMLYAEQPTGKIIGNQLPTKSPIDLKDNSTLENSLTIWMHNSTCHGCKKRENNPVGHLFCNIKVCTYRHSLLPLNTHEETFNPLQSNSTFYQQTMELEPHLHEVQHGDHLHHRLNGLRGLWETKELVGLVKLDDIMAHRAIVAKAFTIKWAIPITDRMELWSIRRLGHFLPDLHLVSGGCWCIAHCRILLRLHWRCIAREGIPASPTSLNILAALTNWWRKPFSWWHTFEFGWTRSRRRIQWLKAIGTRSPPRHIHFQINWCVPLSRIYKSMFTSSCRRNVGSTKRWHKWGSP